MNEREVSWQISRAESLILDSDVYRLHIYIHDYLSKRGFNDAAHVFGQEARLGDQIAVPVDAAQGLLYEWWNVFWELFSASNGAVKTTNTDAAMYVEVSKN